MAKVFFLSIFVLRQKKFEHTTLVSVSSTSHLGDRGFRPAYQTEFGNDIALASVEFQIMS